MEEGKKHIDDLFREELGNHQEAPGDHVWAALEKKLAAADDGGLAAPAPSYRWVWYVLLMAALVILGYLAFTRLNTAAENSVATTEQNVVQQADAAQSMPGVSSTTAAPAVQPATEQDEKNVSGTNAVAAQSTATGNSIVTQPMAGSQSTTAGRPLQSSSNHGKYVTPAQESTTGDPLTSEEKTSVPANPTVAAQPAARTTVRMQHRIKISTTTLDADPAAGAHKQSANPVRQASARTDQYGSAPVAANSDDNSIAAPATKTITRTGKPTATAAASGTALKAGTAEPVNQPPRAVTKPKYVDENGAPVAETPVAEPKPAHQQTTGTNTANATKQPTAKTTTNNKAFAGSKPTGENEEKAVASAKTVANSKSANTGTSAAAASTATRKGGENKTVAAPTTPAAQANEKNSNPLSAPSASGQSATQNTMPPSKLVPSGTDSQERGNEPDKGSQNHGQQNTTGNTHSGQLSNAVQESGREPVTIPQNANTGVTQKNSSIKVKSSNTLVPAAQSPKTANVAAMNEIALDDKAAKQEAEKNKLATAATTTATPGGKTDDTKKRNKKASPFEGGIKLGYEFNFAQGNANKYVIAPYLQYFITPDVSIVLQPAFKFGKASVGNVAGASSYYETTGHTFDSTRTITTGTLPSSNKTVTYKYNYQETYDSLLLVYSVSNQQLWDIELPILLRYNLVPTVAFYIGPTLTYSGKLLQIDEDRQMYSGQKKNASFTYGPYGFNDSTVPPGPAVAAYETVFSHSARPMSEVEKDRYINGPNTMFSLGYMAGFSFSPVRRLMVDVQFQQRFVSNKNVPVQRFKDVYTQPYMRISLGYRLFGDRKKMVNAQP